jgi:limonene 1,2-monooxygenase
VSPSGSKTAGRHGVGLLSIAATDPVGSQMLSGHWDIVQSESQARGLTVGRDKWRLMGPMHIAETVEQAKKNCEYGLMWIMEYLSHIIPTGGPDDGTPPPATYDEFVDVMNESGRGVIGTPEMAIRQIERLQELSGGFGCYLMFGADIADWKGTLRSYELFAEEVMPHFTGQHAPVQAAYDRVMNAGTVYVDATLNAQMAAIGSYEAEKAARA